MRPSLIAFLIFACVASGCTSTNSRSLNPATRDPNLSQSCYGGPVYTPC